jgi:hypothetical protein
MYVYYSIVRQLASPCALSNVQVIQTNVYKRIYIDSLVKRIIYLAVSEIYTCYVKKGSRVMSFYICYIVL